MDNQAATTKDCTCTLWRIVYACVHRKWIFLWIVQAIDIKKWENFYIGIFEETAWEKATRGIWCGLARNTGKCALWNVHVHMESIHLLGTKVHMPEDIYREEYFYSVHLCEGIWAWSYNSLNVYIKGEYMDLFISQGSGYKRGDIDVHSTYIFTMYEPIILIGGIHPQKKKTLLDGKVKKQSEKKREWNKDNELRSKI